MKINRVIRFKNDPKKVEEEQVDNKSRSNLSPSNDTSGIEQYEQAKENQGVQVAQGKSYNFNIERKSYLEETASISGNPASQLKRYIEVIASGRENNNMIGVFGMNSDVIIQNVLDLREIGEKLLFSDTVNYFNMTSDIYNNIAAILLNYTKNNLNRSNEFVIRRQIYEIMEDLEKVYYDSSSEYYEEDYLEKLRRIASWSERDKTLLSAINKIRHFQNYTSYSRSSEKKILIAVEMQKFDYQTLNSLAKLNSSDLIIIVYSMLDFNMARMSLSSSISGGLDCMDKFFHIGNYVIAN